MNTPELVGLSKTKNDVRKLSHETDRSMIHELEAAVIIGLGEVVSLGESVYVG
jgi:hypothetical protein